LLHERKPILFVDPLLFHLSKHEVVFVVLLEHDLKHVVEEGVLLVGLGNGRTWLQIGRFVFYYVRHSSQYQFLPDRYQRLATCCVELVLEVPERTLRDLHVAKHEVLGDAWVELIEIVPKDDVVLALGE